MVGGAGFAAPFRVPLPVGDAAAPLFGAGAIEQRADVEALRQAPGTAQAVARPDATAPRNPIDEVNVAVAVSTSARLCLSG